MKQVIVFGAGASAGSAGIPLAQDLAWQYYADCADMHELVNGVPVLDQEKIEFKNFRSFLELISGIFPELKGIVKRWEEDCLRSVMNTPWPSSVDKKYCVDHIVEILFKNSNFEGIELVRQIVLEHITGVANNNFGHPQQEHLYFRLIDSCVRDLGASLSLICFNFDTVLKIENRARDIQFDYRVNFAKESTSNYFPTEKISTLKLHGSLDWAYCPNCKKIELLQPVVNKKMYQDRSCKVTPECSGRLKPFIFLPYESGDQVLMTSLWDEAVEKLREADKVTIIGYSFPSYDVMEKNLFRENLKSSVLLEVVNVGSEETILREYKTMFPLVKNIKVFSNGFKNYVEKEIPVSISN